MKYQTRKTLSTLSLIGAIGLAASVFGNGCQGPDAFSSNNGSSETLATDTDDFTPIPGQRTISTVYANQVLNSMVSCTGIGKESVQTKQEWEDRKGTFSDYGYATNVTAPMLMGVTAIAGEVCNDLINIEENLAPDDRNIFNAIDFTSGPSIVTENDIQESVVRMSLSCWQRNLDTEEENIVIDEVSQVMIGASNTPTETRNVALSLCTGILSSLSAIEM